MENKEAHIIQEILDGKTARYEYFVERYSRPVFTLIARVVSNQEDAEELTQDTFLKAFEHLSSFKAESGFSTWIYRIAYNTALSAARKRKFDTCSLDESLLASVTDEQTDTALDNDTEEQLALLEKAMERLDAEERALITLFYMEEKSMKEISLITGLSENHVKVKLHRIRKKLYVWIKQAEQ